DDVDAVHETYLPVVQDKSAAEAMKADVEAKPEFVERQKQLLNRRYDLSDNPSDVQMSGGRKAVQAGVRVKLPDDVTWDELASMTPEEVREKGVFPEGFLPLPHAKHETGGQVFPDVQIEEIRELEQ